MTKRPTPEGDILEGDHRQFCQSANEPATGTSCQHHVGVKWDGSLDLGDDLEGLKRAWDGLCALVDEHGEDRTVKAFILLVMEC
jgi:hypothetical protein